MGLQQDELKRPTFSLRQLFGVVWILSVVFAAFPMGLSVAVLFGVPFGVLGYDFIVYGRVVDDRTSLVGLLHRSVVVVLLLLLSYPFLVRLNRAGLSLVALGLATVELMLAVWFLSPYVDNVVRTMRGAPYSRTRPRIGRLRLLPLIGFLFSLAAVSGMVGLPGDAKTVFALIGVSLWSVLITFKYRRLGYGFLIALPLLFLLNLLFPLYPVPWRCLADLRRGRQATVLPPELLFVRDGPNTSYLETLFGPAAPHWEYCQEYHGPTHARPEFHYVTQGEELHEILAVLPHDAARRRVLQCLTDETNLLRDHQELLLVFVKAFGYPKPRTTPHQWYTRHRAAFCVETDDCNAYHLVKGWAPKFSRTFEKWQRREWGPFGFPTPYVIETHIKRADASEQELAGQVSSHDSTQKAAQPKPDIVWWP